MNYYPYLEKWISDNGIHSDAELARLTGLNRSTVRRLRCGQGEDQIRMSTIRAFLRVTGMTFERCFATSVDRSVRK